MKHAKESDTFAGKVRQFTLRGEIKPGNATQYSINGEDFHLDTGTWVVGVIEVGAIAHIRGVVRPGVGKYATKVTIQRL